MSRSVRWYTSLHRLALLTALSVPLVAPIEAGAQASNASLERGRYLVESILGCGNCHTPKDAQGGVDRQPPPQRRREVLARERHLVALREAAARLEAAAGTEHASL